MSDIKQSLGWGVVTADGAEIWDAEPTFKHDRVTWKDRLLLLFYPKKFLLYRYIERHIRSLLREKDTEGSIPCIVDVGCGTGASVIDLKKLFGRSVDVKGFDVVHVQVDIAEKKIKQHGVWATTAWYDGLTLPLEDASVDVVYTSDVLGHVADVPAWLDELYRVLKPGGILAMFTESSLGKHAYIRNYLMERGVNTDPHAAFHISLYSKATIQELLERTGFDVRRMYTTVWAKFLVHPDELYPALQKQKGYPILKPLNGALTVIKKKLHPWSTALAELYSLVEMVTVGRKVESQGYVVLAKKPR